MRKQLSRNTVVLISTTMSGWKSQYHERIYTCKSNTFTGDCKHCMMNNNDKTKTLGLFILYTVTRCSFCFHIITPMMKLHFQSGLYATIGFYLLTNIQTVLSAICSHTHTLIYTYDYRQKQLVSNRNDKSESFQIHIKFFHKILSKLHLFRFHW